MGVKFFGSGKVSTFSAIYHADWEDINLPFSPLAEQMLIADWLSEQMAVVKSLCFILYRFT